MTALWARAFSGFLGLSVGLLPALFWSCRAAANGRYPEANQLLTGLTGGADPTLVVARATFGAVVSDDGGASWRWVCEQAIGFSDIFDPPVAMLQGDTVIAGLQTTLSRTTDQGCNWQLDTGIFANKYVIDVTARRDQPAEALAVTTTPIGGALESFVARTTDAGASWALTGADLGADFRAVTIEIAPSDATRIYVSGLLEPSYEPVVAVSDDGGQTWSRRTGLGLAGPPFISAIDPSDADRLYARVPGNDIDSLYVSEDGATSFQNVIDRPGRMLGFALSPDGSRIAIGGPGIGIETADAMTLAFAVRSQVSARCLTWTGAKLYVCGDEATDGFTIGTSTDEAATITPIFHLSDLQQGACEATATTCAPFWPGVRELLGLPPETGSSSSGSGNPTGGGGETAEDGCDCRNANGAHVPMRSASYVLAACAAGLLLNRRRRSRPRSA